MVRAVITMGTFMINNGESSDHKGTFMANNGKSSDHKGTCMANNIPAFASISLITISSV